MGRWIESEGFQHLKGQVVICCLHQVWLVVVSNGRPERLQSLSKVTQLFERSEAMRMMAASLL